MCICICICNRACLIDARVRLEAFRSDCTGLLKGQSFSKPDMKIIRLAQRSRGDWGWLRHGRSIWSFRLPGCKAGQIARSGVVVSVLRFCRGLSSGGKGREDVVSIFVTACNDR